MVPLVGYVDRVQPGLLTRPQPIPALGDAVLLVSVEGAMLMAEGAAGLPRAERVWIAADPASAMRRSSTRRQAPQSDASRALARDAT